MSIISSGLNDKNFCGSHVTFKFNDPMAGDSYHGFSHTTHLSLCRERSLVYIAGGHGTQYINLQSHYALRPYFANSNDFQGVGRQFKPS